MLRLISELIELSTVRLLRSRITSPDEGLQAP
jgi:hypothetical protein